MKSKSLKHSLFHHHLSKVVVLALPVLPHHARHTKEEVREVVPLTSDCIWLHSRFPPVVRTCGYLNWDPTYCVDIHEWFLTEEDSLHDPVMQ